MRILICGDRDHHVASLRNAHYDVAIDTSAYHPRHIENVAGVLDDFGQYILVSTASVYGAFPADEAAPVRPSIWNDTIQASPATYADLKRACEEAALRHFGDRLTVLRPGVLVGPSDPTNRFEYWVRRCARGGQMLVPGDPHRRIQILDARDLALWMLHAAGRVFGVFNAAGPEEELTMGSLVARCIAVTHADAAPVWVDDAFLLRAGAVTVRHSSRMRQPPDRLAGRTTRGRDAAPELLPLRRNWRLSSKDFRRSGAVAAVAAAS